MEQHKKPLVVQEQNVVYPVHKTESAQIAIPGGSTKNEFYFPNLPLLQKAHLLNLEAENLVTTPKAPDGTALSPTALLAQTFLTLVNQQGKQILHDCPITKFMYASNSGNGFSMFNKQFKGQRIDWQKSYVRFADNSLIPAAGTDTCILFTVYYVDDK